MVQDSGKMGNSNNAQQHQHHNSKNNNINHMYDSDNNKCGSRNKSKDFDNSNNNCSNNNNNCNSNNNSNMFNTNTRSNNHIVVRPHKINNCCNLAPPTMYHYLLDALIHFLGHIQYVILPETLSAQVKTCFGCGQTLKPGGQIGEPPYDLVIVSNAKRSCYDRAGQLQERPRNVYYHINAGCMKKRQSIFHGITGANTICDQWYDDTSSLSLCQLRIWTRNLKSWTQRKTFDI